MPKTRSTEVPRDSSATARSVAVRCVCLTAVVVAVHAAHAQVGPAAGEVAPAAVLAAPVDAAARPVQVNSGVTVQATVSDNINLAPEETRRSGRALEIAPYIDTSLRTQKSRGDLALKLRGLWVSSAGDHFTRLSPDLRTDGDLSISDDRLRLAGSAFIYRTSPSPFGNGMLDPAAMDVDSELYKAVAISPYSVGRIGSAEYELRYRAQVIDPEISERSASNQISAGLGSGAAGRFGWSTHADARRVDFENNQDFTQTSADIIGYIGITPLLRVGAGINYSRVSVIFDEDGDDSGIGPVAFLSWQASNRTSFMAKYTDAYYGSAGQVRFAHRGARWLAGLSYNRGLQLGNESGLLYFDPDDIFALPRTGMGEDSQLVRGMAQRRLFSGAGAPLIFGQTENALTYSEAVIASFAWLRPRNSLLLSVFSNDQRPPRGITGLNTGAALDQVGVSLTLSHRLDARNTLALSLLAQESSTAGDTDDVRLESGVLSWNTILARQLALTLALRYARQRSTGETQVAEYRERAVIAALDYRF